MADQLMRRDETANYLRSHGLRTTTAGLATMATRGGGPPFLKIGKYSMYRVSDVNLWLSARCSGLLSSTSTLEGRKIDGLFKLPHEGEDISLETVHMQLDVITKRPKK